jgi:hypothetical protein
MKPNVPENTIPQRHFAVARLTDAPGSRTNRSCSDFP